MAVGSPFRAGPVTEEVRFAVVMYGGISLCVYMNGIMQQLLHLVRSTALDPLTATPDAPNGDFLIHDDASMPAIERVYRRLALIRSKANGLVTTQFIVDILSGTSAGGINNLFLARALANEEDVSELTRLWIQEGDIGMLLNDRNSEDPRWGVRAENPPEALLNAPRMAQRLLQAMRGMETTARAQGRASRLVKRLDLHMTATDLQGLDLSLRLDDDAITEKRHRAEFHFVHDPDNVGYFEGQERYRNDFDPRMTPFLTFVARSTSCIAPAFEPMRLDDVANLVDPGVPSVRYDPQTSPLQYSPFFRDFWSNADILRDDDPKRRRRNTEAQKRAFAFRPFGDGGYGDNYPFGYAIDEISRRQNEVRVDRKFLYVEPDPAPTPVQARVREGERPLRPNIVDHLKTMGAVKSTETIREDIDRLREHNRLQEKLGSVRLASEAAHGAASPDDDPAYLRVRASATTDELTKVLANALGFEDDTPYQDAIRAMVKAIRTYVFERSDPKRPPPTPLKPGVEGFLETFDLATLRRWVRFEQRAITEEGNCVDHREIIDALMDLGSELRRVPVILEVATAKAQAAEPEPANAAPIEAVAQTPTPNAFRNRNLIAYFGGEREGIPATLRAMADGPSALRQAQNSPEMTVEQALSEFLAALANLGPPLPGGSGYAIPVRALARLLVDYPVRWTGMETVDRPADGPRIAAAWRLLTGVSPQKPDETDAAFALRANDEAERGRARVERVVAALARIYGPTTEKVRGTMAAQGLSREPFARTDAAMFPVLYGNGEAESGRVDILRVSPLDCRTLADDSPGAPSKLAGTGVGHFAGFFKDVWRAQDILWGRLDGAERLICTVLEDEGFLRRALILQAQLAILSEEDLDDTMREIEAGRSLESKTAPESSVTAMRRKLLVLALDRFAQWASRAQERRPDGTLTDVYVNRRLDALFAQKEPNGRLDPEERRRLLDRAWEGWA